MGNGDAGVAKSRPDAEQEYRFGLITIPFVGYEGFLTCTLNHLRYTVAQKPLLYAVRYRNQDRVRNNGDWQTLYYDTVVELDPIKLLDKIEAAQKAIADRLKNAMNPINANEQQAIENARRNLYFLKQHPAA
jgi:hypothetical protein